MRTFIGVLIALVGLYLSLTYLLNYKSAFEADQACHFDKFDLYGEDIHYGCDHDLETNQWILYEEGAVKYPAKVIRRYHY